MTSLTQSASVEPRSGRPPDSTPGAQSIPPDEKHAIHPPPEGGGTLAQTSVVDGPDGVQVWGWIDVRTGDVALDDEPVEVAPFVPTYEVLPGEEFDKR
jgi:hypothetical protein